MALALLQTCMKHAQRMKRAIAYAHQRQHMKHAQHAGSRHGKREGPHQGIEPWFPECYQMTRISAILRPFSTAFTRSQYLPIQSRMLRRLPIHVSNLLVGYRQQRTAQSTSQYISFSSPYEYLDGLTVIPRHGWSRSQRSEWTKPCSYPVPLCAHRGPG